MGRRPAAGRRKVARSSQDGRIDPPVGAVVLGEVDHAAVELAVQAIEINPVEHLRRAEAAVEARSTRAATTRLMIHPSIIMSLGFAPSPGNDRLASACASRQTCDSCFEHVMNIRQVRGMRQARIDLVGVTSRPARFSALFSGLSGNSRRARQETIRQRPESGGVLSDVLARSNCDRSDTA